MRLIKNYIDVINQCIHYTFVSIRIMASGKVAKQAGAELSLTRDEVAWCVNYLLYRHAGLSIDALWPFLGRLSAHAFYAVFMRKRMVYAHTGILHDGNGALFTS